MTRITAPDAARDADVDAARPQHAVVQLVAAALLRDHGARRVVLRRPHADRLVPARIQSHLLWWGVAGMDLGAITTFLYGWKEREIITDIFEELCGARLTMNFFRPGGSFVDVPDSGSHALIQQQRSGQALSLMGSALVRFALIWWMTERTGSATVLAMATLVASLPPIVLGPLVGALVDRWKRRWISWRACSESCATHAASSSPALKLPSAGCS